MSSTSMTGLLGKRNSQKQLKRDDDSSVAVSVAKTTTSKTLESYYLETRENTSNLSESKCKVVQIQPEVVNPRKKKID